MDDTRRVLIALGVALASVGGFFIAAAASLEFGPPPGSSCPPELGGGCPSHYDVLGLSVDGAYGIGAALIATGTVLVLVCVFDAPALPFTRVDEEAIVERIERGMRRLD